MRGGQHGQQTLLHIGTNIPLAMWQVAQPSELHVLHTAATHTSSALTPEAQLCLPGSALVEVRNKCSTLHSEALKRENQS